MIYNVKRNYTIVYFSLAEGNCPVLEYLESLEKKLQSKTIRSIDLLGKYGRELSAGPYCRYLRDGIYELRTIESSNITRIFYFFFNEDTIVLLSGFTKKTQKMPAREFLKAKRYKDIYIQRKKAEK